MSSKPRKPRSSKEKAPAKREAESSSRPSLEFEDIMKSEEPALPTFRRSADSATVDTIGRDAVVAVRKSMSSLSESGDKRPVRLFSPATMRKTLMPLEDIYEQYAFGSVGLRYPSLVRINGAESTSKTTYLLHLAGQWLARACPVVYIDCENKMLPESRVCALLCRDKVRARMFNNMIYWSAAEQLVQFDAVLRTTLEEARKNCDNNPHTRGNPILVIGDTWTTLMATGEAQGRSDWGLEVKKSPAKQPAAKQAKNPAKTPKKVELIDTGSGSNFGHAKHSQGMKRWLPALLRKYNAMLVLATHQTESISMMPGVPPTPAYKNTNCTGRKGLDAIASYTVVLSRAGDVKRTDGTVIGSVVRAYVAKNSHGPGARSFYFENMSDDLMHTDTEWDDPVVFGERTSAWMAQSGLIGTTVSKKRYSCGAIGATSCTGRDFYSRLLTQGDMLDRMGAALDIEGYATLAETSRAAAVSRVSDAETEDPFDDGGDV